MDIDYNKKFWFKCENEDRLPGLVTGTFMHLEQRQSYRKDRDLINLRLYGAKNYTQFSSGNYHEKTSNSLRLKYNIVRSIVDTAKAYISTNQPKVKFTTTGGDYDRIKKAEKLSYFISGQFRNLDIYKRLGPDAFRDGSIFGTGIIYVYDDGDEIKAERVVPCDLVLDDAETRDAPPLTIYRHKSVNKYVLAEEYPDQKDDILDSTYIRETSYDMDSEDVENISLVEAFRLGVAGKPGRHVICTSNSVILDEEWHEKCFPYAIFRWKSPVLGYFGDSMAEELLEIQYEINFLCRKIQSHMNLGAMKILLDTAADVSSQQINNLHMGIIKYTSTGGNPPSIMAIPPVAREYFEQLDRLEEKAYNLIGVSQMAAQSQKPPGLNSGKAIIEYRDIQNKRFTHIQKQYDWFHVDLAKLIIQAAKRINDKNKGSYKILAEDPDGDQLIEINWNEISLEDDMYIMKPWPTGLLPEEPSGQLEIANQLIQMDPRYQNAASALLDFHDVKAVTKRINAPYMLIAKIIDAILDGKEYLAPDPFMDLNLGIEQMNLAIQNAMEMNISEDKLDTMRIWIEEAEKLLQPPPMLMAPPQGIPSAPSGVGPAGGPPGPNGQAGGALPIPITPEQGLM